MTLALRCAVVFAFDYLHCNRLQISVNEGNRRSARVAEKAGFKEEARLRNFEAQPTDELRKNGYEVQEYALMMALFPGRRSELSWYPQIISGLDVVNL